MVDSGRYPSVLDVMRDRYGITGRRRDTTTLLSASAAVRRAGIAGRGCSGARGADSRGAPHEHLRHQRDVLAASLDTRQTSAASPRRMASPATRGPPGRGVERPGHPASSLSSREPLAQQRPSPCRPRVDHASGTGAGSLLPQARRAEVLERSATEPQAAAGEGRPPAPGRRSRRPTSLDIEAL